jgi:hypothetical protein
VGNGLADGLGDGDSGALGVGEGDAVDESDGLALPLLLALAFGVMTLAVPL